MDRVKGKVAFVSGAGSIGPGWGNGKAVSVLYAREGASVLCLDVNGDAAEETAALIREEGGRAIAFAADVTDGKAVAEAVQCCMDHYGRIDILHNNVGIVTEGGAAELDEATWKRVVDINLNSLYHTHHHVLPIMVGQGSGAVVNIASIAGIRWTGVPYISYSTTKGAVIPFTRSVALQYAKDGIRANTILPGLLDTPMVTQGLTAAYGSEGDVEQMKEVRNAQCPMGRMGDAWDVAYASLFLASDEARYITGTELVVDGGITAKF
ncbi:MAG: SDR family oxidoreductase [Alphaproteobacteria bacterium]|nr:SDR family oxidoreductase [Alphaproteobacteria bacterium]